MTTTLDAVDVTDPAVAAEIIGPIRGPLTAAQAGSLAPGDYLPPQHCLASTAWRTSGFQIGSSTHAVDLDAPGHQGKVLLLGPLGALHGLPCEAIVHVIRPDHIANRPAGTGAKEPRQRAKPEQPSTD